MASILGKIKKNIEKKYDDAQFNITEPTIWLHSGNWTLNHILSGKFSRGYPAGRITQVFGDSGCLTPEEKIKVYKFKSKIC